MMLEKLQEERDHAQSLAYEHANAMLFASVEDRPLIMESLSMYSDQRDVLDQQIAWMNRRTGWVYPREPAWTD